MRSTRDVRKDAESAWKNTEVDALYKLVHTGVRGPEPNDYFKNTLVVVLVSVAVVIPRRA